MQSTKNTAGVIRDQCCSRKNPEEDFMARIILAEDDRVSCFIVDHFVRSLGHITYCCQEGLEAYKIILANASAYDLILTDIAMPNLDGISLCKKIHFEMRIKTPIIAMTSYERSIFNQDVICFFDGWLLKPIRKELLEQTINRALNLSEKPDAL